MPTPPLETPSPAVGDDTCSTTEAAQWLGMAVRSVQLMVDRGDLQAWKTPGGHRRISRASIRAWLAQRGASAPATQPAPLGPSLTRSFAPTRPADLGPAETAGPAPLRILLIEDSAHFQSLVSLLVKRELPEAELHVATDGIGGLGMAGRLDPDLLLVDILLPGIDGATLITGLRSDPQFSRSRLIVITALDESQRAPYAFALDGVPVVHKPQLVMQLPPLLAAFKTAA